MIERYRLVPNLSHRLLFMSEIQMPLLRDYHEEVRILCLDVLISAITLTSISIYLCKRLGKEWCKTLLQMEEIVPHKRPYKDVLYDGKFPLLHPKDPARLERPTGKSMISFNLSTYIQSSIQRLIRLHRHSSFWSCITSAIPRKEKPTIIIITTTITLLHYKDHSSMRW